MTEEVKKVETVEEKKDWVSIGSIGVERSVLDKALAKQKLRIVKMTDVTASKEALSKALIKLGIPGNECIAKADRILKILVLGDDIGKLASVEKG